MARTDTLFFESDFSICVVCPSEVDKRWVPAIYGELMVKSKLPPQSDFNSSPEAVEPRPWKRSIKTFLSQNGTFEDQDYWSMIGKLILPKGRI